MTLWVGVLLGIREFEDVYWEKVEKRFESLRMTELSTSVVWPSPSCTKELPRRACVFTW